LNIERVGVIGGGLMGSGIAEVCARVGSRVVVHEIDAGAAEAALQRIERSLARALERGKLDETTRDEVLGRITVSTDISEQADRQLVIEAATENEDVKRQIFSTVDEVLTDTDAILASNTSSIPITRLASATDRAHQVVGLHFFNPVPVMKLVEIVRTGATSDATFDAAMAFARSLGKVPVACRDNSGFIVNRLLVPYMLDAIRAYEEGVGSIEDIDTAMRLGTGHPMGPFTLGDFVGLDTLYYITEIMFDEYREKRFASPALLKRMHLAGYHGRKTGKGFYDYGTDPPVVSDFVRR
jgi:3-hydroxybutyryl-CoA dehydrogenase